MFLQRLLAYKALAKMSEKEFDCQLRERFSQALLLMLQ